MRKVLIVDDNALNRAVLVKILGDDYELLEAADGLQALSVLADRHTELSAVLLDLIMPVLDGYAVLKALGESESLSQIPVIVTTGSSDDGAEVQALSLGANDYIKKPYNPAVIRHRLWNTINLRETAAFANAARTDRLTGLLSREAFFEEAAPAIAAKLPGHYILSSLDVDNFKVVNDQYGTQRGNEVLCHIADTMARGLADTDHLLCRMTADKFAVLYPAACADTEKLAATLAEAANPQGLLQPLSISVGRYPVTEVDLPVSAMYDRAVIAQTSVKGRFDLHIAVYTDAMRNKLLREQEIVDEMSGALAGGQFEMWLQPQYNHDTGALAGAEALVRWRHPRRGMVSPGEFIPVFERGGFIYEMDKYIWEQVCILQRRRMDAGAAALPVSVNVSRYDIFREDFFAVITGLLEKYGIPVDLLRVEITESAFTQNTDQIIAVVQRLSDYGFTVEIDDFGSGYSSLNTLKDVPARLLKLDMRFLEKGNSQRGGNILESIVRMAKWLGMPIIAEGVETAAQADYLKSIGCFYVQGYLYAKPMPAAEFEALALTALSDSDRVRYETVDALDNDTFWDPNSMETLIFNSYVGAACVFEARRDKYELLRANDKLFTVLGEGLLTAETALGLDWAGHLSPEGRASMGAAMALARETGEEARAQGALLNMAPGLEAVYFQAHLRVIARADDHYLFYCIVENTTARHIAQAKERAAAQQLSAILDNVNSGVTAALLGERPEKVFGGDASYIFANNRFFAMLGYTKEQFLAELPDYYAYILPADRPEADARAAAVNKTGTADTFEFRARRRDGEVIWLRANISRTVFEGSPGYVQLAVLSDITKEREASRRALEGDLQLDYLYNTIQGVLSGEDAEAVMATVLGRAMAHFSGERAYVFELDDTAGRATNTYEVCAPGVRSEKARLQNISFRAISKWFSAFEKQGYISIGDVASLDEARSEERAILREQGISSLLAVPLVLNGRPTGFLGIDNPTANQGRIGLLTAIGGCVTAILARRDANRHVTEAVLTGQELMDDTPGGFCRMRVDENDIPRIDYVNLGFCQLAGLAREEIFRLSGQAYIDHVHPDDAALVRSIFADLLANEESFGQRFRLRRRDGRYVLVRLSARLSRRRPGQRYLNLYFMPSDPASLVENNLRDLLPSALSILMEGSGDLAFVKDKAMCYIYANPSFARLCGFEDDRPMRGKTDFELIDKTQARAYAQADAQVLKSGLPLLDYQVRIAGANGDIRWSTTSKYPLKDAVGRVVGLFGIGRDITGQKAMEDRLRITEEEMALAMAKMGKMICIYDIPRRTLTMPRAYADRYAVHTLMEDAQARILAADVLSRDTKNTFQRFSEAVNSGAPFAEGEWLIRHADGEYHWEAASSATVYDADRRPVRAIISVEDSSARHRIHVENELLRENERLFRTVAAHSNRVIFRCDLAAGLAAPVSCPAPWGGALAMDTDLPQGPIAAGVVLPESADAFRALFTQMANGSPAGDAKLHLLPGGSAGSAGGRAFSAMWADVRYTVLPTSDGRAATAVLSFLDITADHERELAYARYRQTIGKQSDGRLVWFEADITADTVLRHGGNIPGLYFPDAGTPYSETAVLGVENHIAPEARGQAEDFFYPHALKAAFAQGRSTITRSWPSILPDVESSWLQAEIHLIEDPYSGHLQAYTILRDITEEKRAALAMVRKAETDGMTDLYNKATAEAMARRRLSAGDGTPVALLMVDLDNLKTINDSEGHTKGDMAIKAMAGVLRASFRKTDLISRFGGDEFMVLLDGIDSKPRLCAIIESLMKRLAATYIGEGEDDALRGSVGVATGLCGRDTFDELLNRADKALYHVKRTGKNNYAFYTPQMDTPRDGEE